MTITTLTTEYGLWQNVHNSHITITLGKNPIRTKLKMLRISTWKRDSFVNNYR